MKNIKCKFCEKHNLIGETDFFKLMYDKYPVTDGHILIISKSHKENYSKLDNNEKKDLFEAIDLAQTIIKAKYNVEEFNVGFNQGYNAGQTIFHFHCHVIPRRMNDIENPEGGIRCVIHNKQKYNESI